MFTSAVTSARHSHSVILLSYQCSLFLSRFANFLNKIRRLTCPAMKAKQMLKFGSLTNKSLIDHSLWKQLTSINEGWLYCYGRKWQSRMLDYIEYIILKKKMIVKEIIEIIELSLNVVNTDLGVF
jgi:uncharacterized protein YbdZ (MbtH family)